MKSLRYQITGRPGNLSDCLDYARKESPGHVVVTTSVAEFIREWFLVTQYIAVFHWVFPGREVTCETVIEGYLGKGTPLADEAKAATARADAKRNLERIVRDIAEAGAEIDIPGDNDLWRACDKALYV